MTNGITEKIERALVALGDQLASPLGNQLEQMEAGLSGGVAAPRLSDVEDGMLRRIRAVGCLRRLDNEQIKLLQLKYGPSHAYIESFKGADGTSTDSVRRRYPSNADIGMLCGLSARQVQRRLEDIRRIIKETP